MLNAATLAAARRSCCVLVDWAGVPPLAVWLPLTHRDSHGALPRHEALGFRGAAMSTALEAHRQRGRLRDRRGREPRYRRCARPRHRDVDFDHGDGCRRSSTPSRSRAAGPRSPSACISCSRSSGRSSAPRPPASLVGPDGRFRAALKQLLGKRLRGRIVVARSAPRARRADQARARRRHRRQPPRRAPARARAAGHRTHRRRARREHGIAAVRYPAERVRGYMLRQSAARAARRRADGAALSSAPRRR